MKMPSVLIQGLQAKDTILEIWKNIAYKISIDKVENTKFKNEFDTNELIY